MERLPKDAGIVPLNWFEFKALVDFIAVNLSFSRNTELIQAYSHNSYKNESFDKLPNTPGMLPVKLQFWRLLQCSRRIPDELLLSGKTPSTFSIDKLTDS